MPHGLWPNPIFRVNFILFPPHNHLPYTSLGNRVSKQWLSLPLRLASSSRRLVPSLPYSHRLLCLLFQVSSFGNCERREVSVWAADEKKVLCRDRLRLLLQGTRLHCACKQNRSSPLGTTKQKQKWRRDAPQTRPLIRTR